ncbi:MAG: (Fe-S)-binding protein [Planctomycetes bacterium]|nr:(Fe-S)-binding protein [Planctomycetota bacterium]
MTKVSLFVPCYINELQPRVAIDSLRLLRSLGCEVSVPRDQTCCGQPAYNSGYRAEAKKAAEWTRDVFRDSEYVVCPSGSCTSMVHAGYPALGVLEKSDVSRFYELSDFIVTVLGKKIDGALAANIALHKSCHALRDLRISRQPETLIESIRGARLRKFEEDDFCCGFGGTFSVTFPELSVSMTKVKLDAWKKSEVDIVTGVDASCLMQLEGVARGSGYEFEFLHLASLLARASAGG